jgi:hypothetical protein
MAALKKSLDKPEASGSSKKPAAAKKTPAKKPAAAKKRA